MNLEERNEYVAYRINKANETFEVAELLISNQKWNSAINRLYYAAYYAVTALLVSEKIITKTHSGVKTQFFLKFIKTRLIDKELGKVYSDLFDWRQKGDYGDFFDFSEEDVKSIYLPTRKLINVISGILNE